MSKKRTIENPFPGLRPFEPHESHLFFGREGQSQELLCRLRKNRFLAVVGTSGSGKSSLVRAGLLPALHGGFMAGAGSHWRIAILRPGANPIGNLAQELSKPGVLTEARSTDKSDDPAIQSAITESTLHRSDSGLVEAVRQSVISKDENLLIVVDQFEELFRFKASAGTKDAHNEAAAFVKLLLNAMTQKDVPIYVVITMRSDFLGECAQFRDLPETINKSQYLIPRMTRDQRREAITGPIAVGGAQITTRLVQRLLNDVSDDPDQLPILQHALMRTWDYWSNNQKDSEPIDIYHYENIGGMERALSLHADEAYDELKGKNKKIAEILFKRLTEKGPDNREIRRSAKVREICKVARAREIDVIDVIEIFRRQGRSFLMPPPDIKLNKETLIDISHESLIRNWKRLKDWVDEESQSSQIYRRLAETAILYYKNEAGIWRDPDLQIALNWYQQNNPNEIWAGRYNPEYDRAINFLDESKRNHDAEIRAKELRQKRELKRTRIFAGILAIAFLIALGLAYFAFTQSKKAEKEEKKAQTERERAEASARKAEENEKKAIEEAKKAKAAEADEATQRQIAQEQAEIASKNEAKALMAAEKESIARAKTDTLSFGYLARALAGLSLKQGQLGDSELAALLARQAFIYNNRYGKEEFNQEIYEALCKALDQPQTLNGHEDLVRAIVISPDGKMLASGSMDGIIRLWNISQSSTKAEVYKVLESHQDGVRCLAFSPDGYILASGSDDYKVCLWDIKELNDNPLVLKEHTERVWSVAFNQNGEILASGGADSTVRIWKLDNFNAKQIHLLKHNSWVRGVAFSPNGKWLASGTENGTVLLWDLQRLSESPNELNSHKIRVNALAFSPDGLTLASSFEDGTIQLWDIGNPNFQSRELEKVHKNSVTSVEFSSDGHMLASGSLDREVRIWHKHQAGFRNILTLKHESFVLSVDFSPDDQLLISGCDDRNIYIWLTQSSLLAELVCNKIKRNLSPKEWRKYVGPEMDYEFTCPGVPSGESYIPDNKK